MEGSELLIKECVGYELIKEKPTSPEEFFNRSEIKYIDNKEERLLQVLYVRFFDENFEQFVPYSNQPLFTAGEREVYFKDIVALVCLLHSPENKKRKRIYISSQEEFAEYFKSIDYKEIEKMFNDIEEEKKKQIIV